MRFNINFNKPNATYLSGETISGKLSIYNSNGRLKVKKIVVKLRGQAEVR